MKAVDHTATYTAISSTSLMQKIIVLFFAQLFAALTYSALYSTLIFFATKQLHITDTFAVSIVGSFIAYNYALHLLGGYLGGRWLSFRSLYCLSILLVVIGGFIISFLTIDAFYWGLAFFLTGAGTGVTCLNCMVTQLFMPNDHRRETVFLLIYVGMNIGLFIGYGVSGYLQLQNNYHLLFLLSSLGTSIALILLLMHWNYFPDINTHFIKLSGSTKIMAVSISITIMLALVPILHQLLHYPALSNHFIFAAGILMLVLITILALRQPNCVDRNKMLAYVILSCAGLVFWSLYLMMPMGLSLFIARNVDRHILGILIAPQWIQNINALIIIISGPFLAWLFRKLRNYQFNISESIQFSCALLLIGMAFIILTIGIHYANSYGLTSMHWLLLSCCFYSLGELFISPIGYSMIGRLAPASLQSVMMGNWMMITGVAATLSSYFSNKILNINPTKDALQTNISFSHNFFLLGCVAVIAGLTLLSLTSLFNRLIYSK